jgi:hypothetical protein
MREARAWEEMRTEKQGTERPQHIFLSPFFCPPFRVAKNPENGFTAALEPDRVPS